MFDGALAQVTEVYSVDDIAGGIKEICFGKENFHFGSWNHSKGIRVKNDNRQKSMHNNGGDSIKEAVYKK